MLSDGSKRVPCWSETIRYAPGLFLTQATGYPSTMNGTPFSSYMKDYSAPKNWRIIGCISMACSF